MKLPCKVCASAVFSTCRGFGLLIFYLKHGCCLLIKYCLWPEQDSNLHELYSVLVSTFTGIIVIIFTELAGLSYLAAYLPDLSYR
jgi:hypothetical protein